MGSDEDISVKEMIDLLALITKEYKRGSGGRGRGRELGYRREGNGIRDEYERREDFDRRGGYERRDYDRREWHGEEEQRSWLEDTRMDPHRNVDGCFRCGKPGHYAAECWASGPMIPQKPTVSQKSSKKPKQDAAYFKRKQTSTTTRMENSVAWQKKTLTLLAPNLLRRLMIGPKSKTPLIFTNVAFEDYIDSFSASEERDSIPRKFVRNDQIGGFEFGLPETQEHSAFFCVVKSAEKELSSEAPEFFPTHLTENCEESTSSGNDESLSDENFHKDLINVDAQTHNFSQFDRDINPQKEYTSDSEVISPTSEAHQPRFTRREKEKWPITNKPSVTVIAGSSKKGKSKKKAEVFQNKEPRYVMESCIKKPKTKKGFTFCLKTYVPIFEKFNAQFKSLSCNAVICECYNIVHDLSDQFHNSSSRVMSHRGPSSRDTQRQTRKFVSQKNKTNSKNVVAYLKQANLKGPNWREHVGKFDPKGDDAIFVGYAWECVAYKVDIPRTQIIVVSTNVRFDDSFQVTQDKFTEELQIQAEASPNATITDDLERQFNDWYEDFEEVDRNFVKNNIASANTDRASPSKICTSVKNSNLESSSFVRISNFSTIIPTLASTDVPELINPPEPNPISFSTISVEETSAAHEDSHDDANQSESLHEVTSNINLTHPIKWTKDHPQTEIIGDPSDSVKTRANVNYCLFSCFVSKIKPKKVTEALTDPFWVEAMQDELIQFERNNVCSEPEA
ncbi:hypothetical protein OSB04_024699 [Centaurea solstitialis]|uniref:CCHC-type domain-containing protein n=1 Tax=Centaurea solstitialis TaxID=347529 RepID=A0AA38T542_9ASTR|nr:hypothetical protein OSB04_024699 [Centaurea solstitialis]